MGIKAGRDTAAGKTQIQLGDVSPTRDFNYVKDTVNGFIAIAEAEESTGKVINIGSNYEVTIGDTANMIANLMGVQIEIETDDQRLRPEKSEVERLWADNSRAMSLTGWKPAYAGIDGFRSGLKETIEWFTDKNNLSMYKTEIYNI